MKEIKIDRYRSKRGGHSQILIISCGKCDGFIARYQKDGTGQLIRLYLDRIRELNPKINTSQNEIVCPKCTEPIGNQSIYKPEQREAIFLKRGSIKKHKEK